MSDSAAMKPQHIIAGSRMNVINTSMEMKKNKWLSHHPKMSNVDYLTLT